MSELGNRSTMFAIRAVNKINNIPLMGLHELQMCARSGGEERDTWKPIANK